MARTETTVEITRKSHRFFWPEPFLNFWLCIIMGCGLTQIIVFSMFIQDQNQFGVGIPWLFPYGICVGALTIALIVYVNISSVSRNLIPSVMMMFAWMFFALYMAGLVETSIQLFGSGGNVNGNCRTYIMDQPVRGESLATLAWLEQYSICQSWYASFAFWIIGVIFFIWLFIMALVVNQNQVDNSHRFTEDD